MGACKGPPASEHFRILQKWHRAPPPDAIAVYGLGCPGGLMGRSGTRAPTPLKRFPLRMPVAAIQEAGLAPCSDLVNDMPYGGPFCNCYPSAFN